MPSIEYVLSTFSNLLSCLNDILGWYVWTSDFKAFQFTRTSPTKYQLTFLFAFLVLSTRVLLPSLRIIILLCFVGTFFHQCVAILHIIFHPVLIQYKQQGYRHLALAWKSNQISGHLIYLIGFPFPIEIFHHPSQMNHIEESTGASGIDIKYLVISGCNSYSPPFLTCSKCWNCTTWTA